MEQLMPALNRLNQLWVKDPTAEGSDAYRIFLSNDRQKLRKAVRLIEQAYERCDDDQEPDNVIAEAEYEVHNVLRVSSIAHDWKHWQWETDVPILAGLGIELRIAELTAATFRVRLRTRR
jgi:hypothetical protein